MAVVIAFLNRQFFFLQSIWIFNGTAMPKVTVDVQVQSHYSKVALGLVFLGMFLFSLAST
jgi:hypothetical protein